MEVSLSYSEMMVAALVGILRQVSSTVKGLKHAYGFDGKDTWQAGIEGAMGEMAVAKALNIYWSAPVDTFKKGGDVGPYQVRTTPLDGSLIVRAPDRNGDIFILVTGCTGTYRVHGWVYGHEAKQPQWEKAPGGRPPAWFVPQSALHPLEELDENRRERAAA